ncbi:glycosyltransferase family 4 protein [Acuticoccus sp. MNP-M23]|uniref:glycosyltransferase family 4 protein n=1 Tax=Acuticoccus sp. MNP-M23 TaxID=3072793 RepID=UPI002816083F|nr:glycosyltransferase family 4 protein [Acuticoccus sp. MNP-M23]WMS43581.1 glycosyltransferase family 4 protein [Acuticoccus sp. MNP-M23]
MHWIVAPSNPRESHHTWLPHFAPEDCGHTFETVAATYDHDRSRASTSLGQWGDYFGQARAVLAAARRHRGPVGIITVFPQLAMAVGLLKRLTLSRVPVIAYYFNTGALGSRIKRRVATLGLGGIDRFVLTTHLEIPAYATALGLPETRFAFAPFTVRREVRSLKVDEDAPFVVAMGSHHRDYATLCEALRGFPGNATIVAGPHATEGLDLPDNVTVRSGLPLVECHALAQRARINVVPLDGAAMGAGTVTIVEAMMFGAAVIATNANGADDYVADGTTGILTPLRDAAALRRTLDALWTDEPRRTALGNAAANAVTDEFSHEAGARRLIEICNSFEPPR